MNTHAQWHVGDGGGYKNNQIYMVDGDYRDYLATVDNEDDARLIVRDHNLSPKLAEALRGMLERHPESPGTYTPEGAAARAALEEWNRA